MDRFPLPSTANYSYQQNFALDHLGIDLMAPKGTPVVAVESGTALATTEPKGGNVVYLEGKSTNYFYGHLERWAPKLLVDANPRVKVNAGDELGFVGTTGNAAGRPPHLHFQMRDGSLVIDPFDALQAVDPQPRRGRPGRTVRGQTPGSSALPAGVLWLAIIWLASRWE